MAEKSERAAALQIIRDYHAAQLTELVERAGHAIDRLRAGDGDAFDADQLRSVARAIEEATGLTAYDPQADAPFIDSGHQTAAAAFDQVDVSLRGGGQKTADQPKRSRFSARGADSSEHYE